jgi:hypothetical protein
MKKLRKIALIFCLITLLTFVSQVFVPNMEVHALTTGLSHTIELQFYKFELFGSGGPYYIDFSLSATSERDPSTVYTADTDRKLVPSHDFFGFDVDLVNSGLSITFDDSLDYPINVTEQYWISVPLIPGSSSKSGVVFTIDYRGQTSASKYNDWIYVDHQVSDGPNSGVRYYLAYRIWNRVAELNYVTGPNIIVKDQSYTWYAYGGDPDGDKQTLQWMIDGTVQPETSSSLTRTWPAGSTLSYKVHTVSVKAKDFTGVYDSPVSTTFNLINKAPQLTSISGPASALSGASCTFFAQCSDSDRDPITYVWTLNGAPQTGGVTSTNTGSTWTTPLYVLPGTAQTTHTIKLIATDSHGLSDVKTSMITVNRYLAKGEQTTETQSDFSTAYLMVAGIVAVVVVLAAVIALRLRRNKDRKNPEKTAEANTIQK